MLHSSTQIFPKIPYCLADTPIGEGCVGLGGWHGGGVNQLNCQTHLQRLKLVKNSVKKKKILMFERVLVFIFMVIL